MQNDKLTAALAALKKVTKGDGVVAMDAEELTKYAEEQIAKAASDEDKGDARIAALTSVVSAASDVFKATPTAKFEFIPHPEKPTEGSLEALARDVATIKSALLSKAEADQTKAVIHPPPIPEGHDGGSVSTNQPQGDDNGPRSEATKSDAAPAEGAAAAAAAAPAEGAAAAAADAKADEAPAAAAEAKEDEGEDVAKSADPFSWPTDMAKDAQREKAEKRAALAKRSKGAVDWGRDGEAPPSA